MDAGRLPLASFFLFGSVLAQPTEYLYCSSVDEHTRRVTQLQIPSPDGKLPFVGRKAEFS